ncbi:MAG: hypothetical protein WCF65_06770 [Parachlamydiaceae bacterium]
MQAVNFGDDQGRNFRGKSKFMEVGMGMESTQSGKIDGKPFTVSEPILCPEAGGKYRKDPKGNYILDENGRAIIDQRRRVTLVIKTGDSSLTSLKPLKKQLNDIANRTAALLDHIDRDSPVEIQTGVFQHKFTFDGTEGQLKLVLKNLGVVDESKATKKALAKEEKAAAKAERKTAESNLKEPLLGPDW